MPKLENIQLNYESFSRQINPERNLQQDNLASICLLQMATQKERGASKLYD